MTRPASGRPASSSRARSSAWPSRVAVPPYFRSPADADAVGRGREAEEPDDEALRQGREQLRIRAVQLLLDERAAWLAVAVGDRHAPRVVDQDAEEVLLRHGRLENQRRPEQAEEQDGERGEPQADQDDAIARTIGRPRCRDTSGARGPRAPCAAATTRSTGAGQPPAEIPLLEHERRVFEEKTEECIPPGAHSTGAPSPGRRNGSIFFDDLPTAGSPAASAADPADSRAQLRVGDERGLDQDQAAQHPVAGPRSAREAAPARCRQQVGVHVAVGRAERRLERPGRLVLRPGAARRPRRSSSFRPRLSRRDPCRTARRARSRRSAPRRPARRAPTRRTTASARSRRRSVP